MDFIDRIDALVCAMGRVPVRALPKGIQSDACIQGIVSALNGKIREKDGYLVMAHSPKPAMTEVVRSASIEALRARSGQYMLAPAEVDPAPCKPQFKPDVMAEYMELSAKALVVRLGEHAPVVPLASVPPVSETVVRCETGREWRKFGNVARHDATGVKTFAPGRAVAVKLPALDRSESPFDARAHHATDRQVTACNRDVERKRRQAVGKTMAANKPWWR